MNNIKQNRLRTVLLVSLLCSLSMMLFAQFGGGNGTEHNPWQVETPQHLDNVRNYLGAANANRHFIQTANIDLDVAPFNEGSGWLPIGFDEENSFRGVYNGDGYTISNLIINRPNAQRVGLFGCTYGARILNVTLANIEIRGRQNVGGLVGENTNRSTISNSRVSGFIIGSDSNLGLLVGNNSEGSISNCSTSGSITGGDFGSNAVGGLVGMNSNNSNISNSFSTANVRGGLYNNDYGGLVGLNQIHSSIRRCYATGAVSVQGDTFHSGGLVGRNMSSAVIDNCYSTGNVDAARDAGGFAGQNHQSRITNSFSTGLVNGGQAGANIGGFTGMVNILGDYADIGNYWNTQTTGQENSAGEAQGRTTAQMTYPYDEQTFINWNFEDIWNADTNGNINNGYPYLVWQLRPNPTIASNPIPEDQASNISINLERLSWSYIENAQFANPVGFRVYFNTTGQFHPEDDFHWEPYIEEQVQYNASEPLPEELSLGTTYYWKVVPTTIDPNERSTNSRERRAGSGLSRASGTDQGVCRGDAENCPVWRFTTERNPNPTVAVNPEPEDNATEVALDLEQLRWSYIPDNLYTDPVGFRVYLNTTGEFGEDEQFEWVPFVEEQTRYSARNILPDSLFLGVTYFWQVIPTTDPAERWEGERNRGDAQNCPVWRFTALGINPNPTIAVNPNPEHLAVGVSPNIEHVSWDYKESDSHTNPVGFRVYMNMTGTFGSNAPYIWVDYEEGVENYYSTEILPTPLDTNTTYFWRVVPTTIHPDSTGRRTLNETAIERSDAFIRGDALNSPIWRFTTGSTYVAESGTEPFKTVLKRNYPNPFNPETTISFTLTGTDDVCITVYNISGQFVTTLINDKLSAGEHSVIWNGRDDENRQVSSGIYFYRMKSGNYTSTNRMVFLK